MPYLGNPAQQRFSSPRAASVYSGDGSTTAFTVTAGHTVNSVIVTENGIVQKPTTDYTVSGTTLTFTTAPANTENYILMNPEYWADNEIEVGEAWEAFKSSL